ncbi:MAG: peptidoglycan-binding protein [bacterium]
MINKYIAGAVSFLLIAFSFISLIPAQQAFAQVTGVTCPVGWVCGPTTTPVGGSGGGAGSGVVATNPTPVTSPACYVFRNNMTVGSTGADVSALQQFLMNNNFLSLKTAVPTGYYAAGTKAAVAAYQAAVGLPATGFVGAITIAKLNASCSSTTTTPPVSISDATATVTGNPSLDLTYGTQHKESLLTASFNLSVNGGVNGINVNASPVGVTFTDQKGSNYYGLISERITLSAADRIDTTTDTYGQKLYVVPARRTVKFQITATVNPQQLFAGTYRASLEGAIMVEVGTNGASQFKLPITKNTSTDSKTIVGEVAPYITAITSPVAVGQTLTITGQRLSGDTHGNSPIFNSGKSTVYINGNPITGVSFSKDGASATLTVPASLVAGTSYTVYISNSVTGESNRFGFEVQGTASSMTVIGPVAGQNFQYGQPVQITWGGAWSGNDVFDITEFVDGYGKDFITSGVTQTQAGCPGYGKGVCGISWTPKYVSSYSVAITKAGSNDVAYSGKFSVSSSTVPVGNASITISGSPTLALTYNSAQRESALTATTNFSVNGGAQGINIYGNGAPVGFVDQNGNTSGRSISNQVTSTNSTPVVTTTDSYGQTLLIIPAGQTVNFRSIVTANPQQMFAGTYHASFQGIMANYSTIGANQNILSAPSNSSNSITIVGELSPYIKSVMTPVVAGQAMTITGQRLSNGSILIDNAAILNSTITRSTDGTSVSVALPISINPGQHYVTISDPQTGLSNSVGFTVTGNTAQTPIISGGTFPTTLSVGQNGTWSVNASDPQNGSLSYSVDWGDTSSCPVGYTCASAPTRMSIQTSTFTHSYSAAGTYTVTFTVRNSAGLSAQTSATVTVGSVVVTPPCPVGYICSVVGGVQPVCPSGYTCTPVTVNCPAGYTCTTMTANVMSTVSVTLDPSSPVAGTIQTNPSRTPNVVLGVFDLKPSSGNATLQSLVLTLNSTGSTVGSTFAAVQLKSGSLVLADGVIASPSAYSSTVTFSNLNFALPANVSVPLTVLVGLYPSLSSGASGNVSFVPAVKGAAMVAVDANSYPMSVSTTGTIQAATQTFVLGGVGALSNLSWSIANPATSQNGIVNATAFNGSFTVTAGPTPVYVPKNPITLTTITNSPSIVATVTNFVPSNGPQSYDGSNYYQVAPGSSRTFNLNGTLVNTSASSMSAGVGITTVFFYNDAALTAGSPSTITLTGLNSDLHMQVVLGGATSAGGSGGGGSVGSTTTPVTSKSKTTTIGAAVLQSVAHFFGF